MILLAIAWYLACGCLLAYVHMRCDQDGLYTVLAWLVVAVTWPMTFPMYMTFALVDRINHPVNRTDVLVHPNRRNA